MKGNLCLMRVWKSGEKLSFAPLISPKIILFEKEYQAFDTVSHHQMRHLKVCQKDSAERRIFNSLLSVSSGDETLGLMLDILHEHQKIKLCIYKITQWITLGINCYHHFITI